MKTLRTILVATALSLCAGCEYDSTKVRVQVLEHKAQAGGSYYALLCRVLEPKDLEGRYSVEATRRSDLIGGIDGGEYEVFLNFTMVGALTSNKPVDYGASPPSGKNSDFLESAKRVK